MTLQCPTFILSGFMLWQLMPDDPLAHNALGMALGKMKEFPNAVSQFQTACRLLPSDVSFQHNLSCVKQQLVDCDVVP